MSCSGKSIVQLGARGGGKVQNDAYSQLHLSTAASQTLGGRLDSLDCEALFPPFQVEDVVISCQKCKMDPSHFK